MARGDLVTSLVEGSGPAGGGGFAPDCWDSGESEPVCHLGGDVGPVLELLAVHAAELKGVEAADRGVFQGLLIGPGEEVEDRGENLPGEAHLGQTDRGDVDLLRHYFR